MTELLINNVQITCAWGASDDHNSCSDSIWLH